MSCINNNVDIFNTIFLINFSSQREPGAIWMPSPHFNSRSTYTAKWLMVHGTAGGSSAEAIGQW